MDTVNNVIFVYCRAGRNCLVLNAADGKILATLPTGAGVDAAEFNPQTMESFSSSGDGKLTVIKETSPTSFVVEQNVTTKSGAKCSTLDSKTGQIYLITADRGGAGDKAAARVAEKAERQRRVRLRLLLSASSSHEAIFAFPGPRQVLARLGLAFAQAISHAC